MRIYHIGQGAFEGCRNLKPEMIASITLLTTGDADNNVGDKKIQEFKNEDGELVGAALMKENISAPYKYDSNGGDSYLGCLIAGNIGKITNFIENGTNTIYYDLFANCASITDVSFEHNITGEGDAKFLNLGRCFQSCFSLKNLYNANYINIARVSTDDTSEQSSKNTFQDCDSLVRARFENLKFEQYTSGDNSSGMFYRCANLNDVEITLDASNTLVPSNNSALQPAMFEACSKLNEVDISLDGSPSNVSFRIPDKMFKNCVELEKIYFRGMTLAASASTEIKSIGEESLLNCSNLSGIHIKTCSSPITIKTDGVKGIGKKGKVYCSTVDPEYTNLMSMINHYGTQDDGWNENDF
ncbi:hypothetical protein FACS189496_4200 [Bacilli bacterium]|nr:hypothetical protein FACS189496_4200 [Bacilli bacterium]